MTSPSSALTSPFVFQTLLLGHLHCLYRCFVARACILVCFSNVALLTPSSCFVVVSSLMLASSFVVQTLFCLRIRLPSWVVGGQHVLRSPGVVAFWCSFHQLLVLLLRLGLLCFVPSCSFDSKSCNRSLSVSVRSLHRQWQRRLQVPMSHCLNYVNCLVKNKLSI